MIPKTLPKPDGYGNFWLSQKPNNGGAAIFKGGQRPQVLSAGTRGRWFASRGLGGVLFEGSSIRYFASPLEALEALQVEEGLKPC